MNNSPDSLSKKDELTQRSHNHQEKKENLSDLITQKREYKIDGVINQAYKRVFSPEQFTLVGVLKNITASSAQFSAGDFTDWLTLPTHLIEETTLLGVLKEVEVKRGTTLPLYSILLARPQTQSEHFFFNLVIPPFFHAAKNSNWADVNYKLSATEKSDPPHPADVSQPLRKRIDHQRRK
ncbi:hypothetical protein H0A71_09995 [Alcaligenaceae bacterium]|nr:hypothetical protein [Alcaligenaceae bacterium]